MRPIITIIIIRVEVNLLCMEPTTCFRPVGLRDASIRVVGMFLQKLKAEVGGGNDARLPAAAVNLGP